MPSRLFSYAFLLSIGFISTFAIQDLRYYQDSDPLIPDLSPEIALKLDRLLKIRNQNGPYGSLPFPHLDDFGVKDQQPRREFERQTLHDDTLAEKSNVIHGHPKKRRQQHVSNYHHASRAGVDHGLQENPTSLREYAERNPREFYSYFHSYPSDIGPLTETKPQRLKDELNAEYPTTGYRNHHQLASREHGMKEVPLLEFLDHQNPGRNYPRERIDDRDEPVVDFTYRLEAPSDRIQELQFALRPNDPGYNTLPEVLAPAQTGIGTKEDERTEGILANNHEEEQEEEEEEEEEEEGEEKKDTVQSLEEFVTQLKPLEGLSNDAEDEVHIGFERRADNHSPLVMAVDPKISNDIYFVAVVAGCSAAAMFILVLISLTWCRLQRGAKAAADVEYPAYGVTGPNKDTSPSGDRRLAQSAQMYHYQHQKQQIIAMESRTATARDPGSVSEAESDEENEEGDYTVYECPGLAPTGEMEVKNPLFHDDPTPATPATQGQKNPRSSEDHM